MGEIRKLHTDGNRPQGTDVRPPWTVSKSELAAVCPHATDAVDTATEDFVGRFSLPSEKAAAGYAYADGWYQGFRHALEHDRAIDPQRTLDELRTLTARGSVTGDQVRRAAGLPGTFDVESKPIPRGPAPGTQQRRPEPPVEPEERVPGEMEEQVRSTLDRFGDADPAASAGALMLARSIDRFSGAAEGTAAQLSAAVKAHQELRVTLGQVAKAAMERGDRSSTVDDDAASLSTPGMG